MPKSTHGHVHQTLELPEGYQHFSWYKEGTNDNNVFLNSKLGKTFGVDNEELYMYTQHEIALQDGIVKQTRSSPNWDGGLVTFSTCKHNMRTWKKKTWVGIWLVGLCPKQETENCVLFIGRVHSQFKNNFELGLYLQSHNPKAYNSKRADKNPRGDIYIPTKSYLRNDEPQFHSNFREPPNHTRSTEFYDKSPGSISEREDGKIPKWWRDIEYVQRGIRPPSFILMPCFLFSKPMLWTSLKPGRAVLNMDTHHFSKSLMDHPDA